MTTMLCLMWKRTTIIHRLEGYLRLLLAAIPLVMLVAIVGYLVSVLAMRHGEIGVVTQFRYSSLLVALALGYLVFGDWPDRVTFIGAGLVVATGLFTLWRERKMAEGRPSAN